MTLRSKVKVKVTSLLDATHYNVLISYPHTKYEGTYLALGGKNVLPGQSSIIKILII